MNIAETGFDVLYEEGACLAVAKPGGLLTQAARGIDSLEVRIKEFIAAREERKGGIYLGMVHRLDRPVSGVLVMGTNRRTARRLAEQFEGRMVHKVYWALVEGQIDGDEGTWRDYLRKIPKVAHAEVVEENSPGAREAILRYQVVHRYDKLCWLQIQLKTGRMHQIRVQAAARGFGRARAAPPARHRRTPSRTDAAGRDRTLCRASPAPCRLERASRTRREHVGQAAQGDRR